MNEETSKNTEDDFLRFFMKNSEVPSRESRLFSKDSSFEDQVFKKTVWGIKFSVLKYFFAGTCEAPFCLRPLSNQVLFLDMPT